MLVFLSGELPEFKKSYEHACKIGKREQFIRCFQMPQWHTDGRRYDLKIGYDNCDHSHSFGIWDNMTSKFLIYGGIIFHEDDQTWGVHT